MFYTPESLVKNSIYGKMGDVSMFTNQDILKKRHRDELIAMTPTERVKWLTENTASPLLVTQQVKKMSTEKFTRWVDICISGDQMKLLNFR